MQTIRNRGTRRLQGVLLAGTLVLAACSESGDDTAEPDPSVTEPVDEPAEEPADEATSPRKFPIP